MKKLAIAVCVLLTNSLFAAAPISISGQGTASYTNLFGKPDKSVENQAKANAVVDAINRSLENQPEALRQQFKSAGSNIPLDDYFSKKLVTETSSKTIEDKENKILTFLFQGNLDLTALRDVLNAVPKDQIKNTVNLSDALVAVFFTVRETAETTVHDVNVKKEVNVSTAKASNSESQGDVSASDTGISKSETSLKQNKNSAKISESGSSTTKSDDVTYRLDKMSKDLFGDGLRARFNSKGINKIYDGSFFDSAEDIDEAYGAGNSIKSKVWKKVVANINEEQPSVKYLIVGTLDFSMPTTSPVTNMPLYSGTVSAKVYELQGSGIPLSVGGLPPLEAKIAASTQQDARKRVVAKLSELAADEIISTLRNKGIL